MEKNEKRKWVSKKILEWVINHKKNICLNLYIVLVMIFTMAITDECGGIQATIDFLNYYPEQEYQQLEEELRNMIVEGEEVDPKKLSRDSLEYEISYKINSDNEGMYAITLSETLTEDLVTITGEVGKTLKKEELKIERDFEKASEYILTKYVAVIFAILLMSLIMLAAIILPGVAIVLLIVFLMECICRLINFLRKRIVKWYNSHKK